jgi:adenosine deaminase
MSEISDSLLLEAQQGNLQPLQALPKSELHAHLLLSAPWSVFEQLAGKKLERPQRFAGLAAFFDFIRAQLLPYCRSLTQFEQLVQGSVQRLLDDGAVVAELSVDLAMPQLLGSSWEELSALLVEAQVRAQRQGCVLRYDLGLARERLGADWQQALQRALELGIFSALDIYGDELFAGAPELEIAAIARDARVPLKVHAGEVGSAQSVVSVLERLSPQAVQHGFRAAESEQALQLLRQHKVACHVAPWANISLGFVESYAQHPIRALFDAGVQVTLNTDDYAIFGRSLSQEYLALYTAGVLSAAELERIRLTGLTLGGVF